VTVIKRIFWLTVMICLILLIPISVHLSTTTLDFSRYTIQWNGTSSFFSTIDEAHIPVVETSDQILSDSCNLLLVIAPKRNLTVADITAYREYLAHGHSLVIADDFGGGTELLTGLGSSIALLEENLSSVDMEYATPTSVIAYRIVDHPLLANVSTIVLNRPAALVGGEPFMMTSVLSWLDVNGNGCIDRNETMQRFAVFSHEKLNGGDLYVFSDPSIFINSMVGDSGMRDNGQFIHNLISSPGLCVDQMVSRTAENDGLIKLMVMVKSTYLIMDAIVGIAMLILAVVWWRGQVTK